MIATTSSIAEQRTLLENISWSTFETLLKEIGGRRGYRIAYDRGRLEIMSPLYEHQNPKIRSDRCFISILAEELGIEIKSAGLMTLFARKSEDGSVNAVNSPEIPLASPDRRGTSQHLLVPPFVGAVFPCRLS